MVTITEPGIYDGMPALEYHSDPCAVPSLTRTDMVRITTASPAHCYVHHPRLGGSPPTQSGSGDAGMDTGSAVHAAFLQGEDVIEHCPVDSWRTNAAKEMRDAALKAGRIPLKTDAYDATMWTVEALRTWQRRSGLFLNGKPEQSVFWREDEDAELWCRARLDFLPDNPEAPLLDLKTTGGLATVGAWGRSCFEHGADLQAAVYPRGVEMIRGEPPGGIMFVVVETAPPYAIRVFALDRIAEEIGQAKAAAARAVWAQCMKAHRERASRGEDTAAAWPAYPPEIEWVLPPPWIVRQWEEAKIGGVGRATEDPGLIERMIRAGNMGG